MIDILLVAQQGVESAPVEEVTEVVKETAEKLAETAPSPSIANLGYLIAAIVFILGIKGMTHPRTAVRGNQLGACGMLLAVLVVLTTGNIISWPVAILGMVVGSAGGVWLAQKVQMTQMPELVAGFHSLVGLAAVFAGVSGGYSAMNSL